MQNIEFSYGVPAVERQATLLAPVGSSIADMAAQIGPYVRAAWIIDFDGQWRRVPIDMWPHVRPRRGGVVHFDCRMGKSALKVVGLVAAVAAAVFLPGIGAAAAGAFGFTSAFAANVATGALGFGLNLLSSRLFSSGGRSGGGLAFSSDNDAQKNNVQSVDTDNNILGTDAYLPRIFGEARISPPDVVQPNVYVNKGAQGIERVLAIHGYNTIHGVYIDGTPAEDIPHVTTVIRQGAPGETTTVPVQRITKPVGTSGEIVGFVTDERKLEDQGDPINSSPTGYRFVIKSMPKATEMTIRCMLEAFADIQSPSAKIRLPLRIRYRPIGGDDTSWINLPEIQFVGTELGRRMFEIRIRRETQVFSDDDAPGIVNHLFWRLVPAVTAHTLADGSENTTQWRAHENFASGTGFLDTTNIFSVRHGVRVFVSEDLFVPGQDYEFDVKRGACFSDADMNNVYVVGGDVVSMFVARQEGAEWFVPVTQNNYQTRLSVLNAAMVRDGVHPVQKPGTSVISLQSRNQTVRNVTAHVTGMAKDWDGSGWNTWVATRNPALCTRQLLEDVMRYAQVADYSRNPRIQSLAASALENTDWLGWKAQCEKMGASCSVIATGQSLMETLLELLGTGLARPAFGDKLRIDYFRDRSAEVPAVTFSPRNAASIRVFYESPRRPMGIRARFRDRAKNWQEREIEIRTPIYGNVPNWDGRIYENIDDENWLRQRVIFDLLRPHYWRVRYEIETDLEGMALKPGALIGLVTDLVDDQGYGARIRQVYPDGRIALDNIMPTVTDQVMIDDISDSFNLDGLFDLNDQAFALVTTPTGAELRAVTDVSGDVITLDSPFGSSDLEGAHISIGPISNRLKRCIVVEESVSGEFSKTIIAADEAPEIYQYMSNTFGWDDDE